MTTKFHAQTDNNQSHNNNIELFHVTLSTKDLISTLGLLNSVVEKKNILPILANIKITTQDNDIILTATDMDLAIEKKIGVIVKGRGELTVAAKILSDIVGNMSDSDVTLKIGNNQDEVHNLNSAYEDNFQAKINSDGSQYLLVLGENCKFRLPIIEVKDFPKLEINDETNKFQVKSIDLIRLIECTKISISNEETRYNFNGIFFHTTIENSTCVLSAVSTDGHRLSLSNVALSTTVNDVSVILPKKACTELHKILRDNQSKDQNVEIILSNTKAQFVCNKIKLTSKLIDGNFPNYQSFIPINNTNELFIDTNRLIKTINRVSTITVNKFKAIKILLNSNQLEFTADGESRGKAHEIIKANEPKLAKQNKEAANENANVFTYEGEQNLAISLNPSYIIDILEVIGTKNVIIQLRDAFSPILIKNDQNQNSLFVVMPIKL